jgi:hypothetical protein
MKYHPSVTRQHLVSKGPAAIAMMVASEFYRASNRCSHEGNVVNAYHRARELMGVLETLRLPDAVCQNLKPMYERSMESELLVKDKLAPDFVKKYAAELADAFNRAASQLG